MNVSKSIWNDHGLEFLCLRFVFLRRGWFLSKILYGLLNWLSLLSLSYIHISKEWMYLFLIYNFKGDRRFESCRQANFVYYFFLSAQTDRRNTHCFKWKTGPLFQTWVTTKNTGIKLTIIRRNYKKKWDRIKIIVRYEWIITNYFPRNIFLRHFINPQSKMLRSMTL